MTEDTMCQCTRTKHREEKESKDLINRLNRIEGQISGLKNMVKDERYCIDIITQVAAVTQALNSFNKVLLAGHIKTCVVDDVTAGNTDKIDELCKTLQKLMK